MALALSTIPNIDRLKTIRADAAVMLEPTNRTDGLVPGAGLLPASIGSKLTIKNVLIGGAVVLAAYLGWTLLAPPKKKASGSSSSSPAAKAVAGLFGARRRRRRR